MENCMDYLSSPTPLGRGRSNTSCLKQSEKEDGFFPSTPRAGLLGKPGTSSWDHTRIQEHSGANAVTKPRGLREGEGLFASVIHERNYEKQPRRKMREAKRGTEGNRKRKRDKRKLGENIGRGPKEARAEGRMLKRVLSSGGKHRDRLTLPPTHKAGLFKKGRASRPIKSGLSDLVFSEMRFLAEPGEDQVAKDPARIVPRREGRLCRPLRLEESHRDRAQKASDIARLDNRAHAREELESKINARRRASNTPRESSLTPKESVSSPDGDSQGSFAAPPALLPTTNLASSQARPGRTSKKKPRPSTVKASVTMTSQDLRIFAEEKPRDYHPRQSQSVSKSPVVRGLVRKGEPQKVEDEEFVIEDYLDRVTEGRNDGEYRKV
ncbi:hypothetical protein B9Z19DRAFT_1112814 [Tuber borchii]|uniref:Uncharacterized protein n=1 Tax=Tuber borchii TaxID=42251 RepID=A0A2T7A454_TUBBO|nr:hypothetical protein B9Z19DRAFT_1112814 [Tuber borchii]